MDLSGYALAILHQDAEFVLWRGIATASPTPDPASVLVSIPTSERPGPDRIRMLEHQLAVRAELDSTWAVRPLALGQHQGRVALVLEDQPGELLERLLDQPMELGLFLRLAAGLASALSEVHRRGIIHKDIKPSHVLVNTTTGQAWLTGFGLSSRLPRELWMKNVLRPAASERPMALPISSWISVLPAARRCRDPCFIWARWA